MLYDFELIGLTALLMHADDIEAADNLKIWRSDPLNKDVSVPGDDRSPAWTWKAGLYDDGEHLAIPVDVLMACLRHAGAQLKLKGNTTYKRLTQTAIVPEGGEHVTFLNNGEQIARDDIDGIDGSFQDHCKAARELGFRLFAKRAKVGQSKHVRVRARFENWSVKGRLRVVGDAISDKVLETLFEVAGRDIGLCDWRPASPKSPGPFGRFRAKVKRVEE